MDWQSWVKTHPWTLLGVALVVGYVIVPRPSEDHSELSPARGTTRGGRGGGPRASRCSTTSAHPVEGPGHRFQFVGTGGGASRSKLCASIILSNGCRNDHSRRPPRQGGLPAPDRESGQSGSPRPLTGFENMADFVTNRPAAACVTAFAVGVL